MWFAVLEEYLHAVYGSAQADPCPFAETERAEFEAAEGAGELLVYLPSGATPAQLCERWRIRANIDFENEAMIQTRLKDESHWFRTSTSKTPELLHRSGIEAKRKYEGAGLHGFDLRRYLAFAAAFRHRFGELPDQRYWCFLLSGSYDRSGISVVGFNANGVLSHHGWMRNFRGKFTGSRYAMLAPVPQKLLSAQSVE